MYPTTKALMQAIKTTAAEISLTSFIKVWYLSVCMSMIISMAVLKISAIKTKVTVIPNVTNSIPFNLR